MPPPLPLQIALQISSGWFHCRVAQGNSQVVFDGSFLVDSIGELAAAVASVAGGAATAEAFFDYDPVHYRCVFERAGSLVRCLVVEGCDSRETDRLLFSGYTPPLELARSVLGQITALADRFGDPRYRTAVYRRSFPEAAVADLRRVVEQLSAQSTG